MKKKIALLILGSILSYSSSSFAAIVEHALFQAYPGKSSLVTKRSSCGVIKEVPYYHSVRLYKDDADYRFMESIYITGIAVPDLQLTGSWSEVKNNKILLSYDGAINEGSTGDNTGWAKLLGDIEKQLSNLCRPVGVTLVAAATELKANTLKISKNGEKAQLKIALTSRSQGGFNKPKATKRTVTAQGQFELLVR